MEYKIFISIFLSIGFVQCNLTNVIYCDDHFPYLGDINLDQIAGVWYGVAIFLHKGEYEVENTNECFHINISEHIVQQSRLQTLMFERYISKAERFHIRYFVLEWHEGGQKLDYYIQMNNLTKGFWLTEPQNPISEGDTRSFFGIIQVLEMTNKYLVLNFCMQLPRPQYFSVILARNQNQLTPEDLARIYHVFAIKNLPTSTVTTVCENSALTFTGPYILLLLLLSSLVFACRLQ